jgi:hypothetical protein
MRALVAVRFDRVARSVKDFAALRNRFRNAELVKSTVDGVSLVRGTFLF